MVNTSMKKIVPEKKTSSKYLFRYLPVVAIVLATNSLYAFAELPEIRKAAYYSIEMTKIQNNKLHKIRMYSDRGHKALLFKVNGRTAHNYQLYLFDMDSRLVTQASIRNHEVTVLNNISKGNYFFEVFIEDEQIETGHLKVK